MKKQKNLSIISAISLADLNDAVVTSDLTEQEKANLAIGFGDDGDLTYELILLYELTNLIKEEI